MKWWLLALLWFVGCSVYDRQFIGADESSSDRAAGGAQGSSRNASLATRSEPAPADALTCDASTEFCGAVSAGGASTPASSEDVHNSPSSEDLPNTEGAPACDDDAGVSCMDGCGVGDLDSDADGTPDCADACASDPDKISPGTCGCGKDDSDTDADGAADCVDGCPSDPGKISAGLCGCGDTDPLLPEAANIYCVRSMLRHRYSFSDAGQTAVDSISGADAALSDPATAAQADGALVLSADTLSPLLGGAPGGYATLPQRVLSELSDATFEVWFSWQPGAATADRPWQRVFDFGTQRNGNGVSYLFLTPNNADGNMRVAYSLGGQDAEASVTTAGPVARNAIQHVAVVIEQHAAMLRLYVEGVEQGSIRLPGTLADLAAENLWLGRSNFAADPAYEGSIREFRVYAAALTGAQLLASRRAGPDYDFSP